MNKQDNPLYILNPKSKRYVLKSGAIGKKIIELVKIPMKTAKILPWPRSQPLPLVLINKLLDTVTLEEAVIYYSNYGFKRDYIFKFVHHKCVKLLSMKNVKHLPQSVLFCLEDKSKLVRIASYLGCLEVVKFLCSLKGVDPTGMENWALRLASENGHLEVVKFLCSLDGVDPAAGDNHAVRIASERGHLEVVKFLCSLDGVDPTAMSNEAVRAASQEGHLEVVKFLCSLDGVDPTAVNNGAIRNASAKGHLEVVKFLCSLDGVDPAARDNQALHQASKNGHQLVVKFLRSIKA